MPNLKPTKYANMLANSLKAQGIEFKQEYWDGHKHVDLFIPESALYIEVDGEQHYTNARQIESDLKRNYYSDFEEKNTIHIPNLIIESKLEKVTEAVIEVIKNRDLEKLISLVF